MASVAKNEFELRRLILLHPCLLDASRQMGIFSEAFVLIKNKLLGLDDIRFDA